ncbi:MAG: hypothetical protein IKW83_05750 [Muribaculaceae bacterium]|nr:hypothetical protein [Muribaculaceae bacterium]
MIDIEAYLSKPYWIIDILPKQVPANADGQYFAIEKYFLNSPRVDAIYQQFADVILKLNCYYDMLVCVVDDEEWVENPAPENLTQMVLNRKPLNIVLKSGQAMIAITGDEHYFTLYNPDKEILELITTLASAEGLHVWKPENIS